MRRALSIRTATRAGTAGVAVAVVAVLAAAGCTSSGKGAQGPSKSTTGPITVASADSSGAMKAVIATWNQAHPSETVTLKALPADAASRRDGLVENLQQRSAGFDVIATDLSSTADFAANKWIEPLTGDRAVNTSGLVAPVVAAGTYGGVLYSEPITAETGLLYYRSDLVKAAPANWGALAAQCSVATAASIACFSGQYAEGEDLTDNAIEAIYAGGGHLLSVDGKSADANTAGTRKGLQFLADSYARKVIPASAITYRTDQSVRAFSSSSLLMLRADADVYPDLVAKSSLVSGKFKVAALPGATGAAPAPFRGLGVSINVAGQNQQTALAFTKYLTSAAAQRMLLTTGSLPPALQSVYDDAALRTKYPFLAALQQSWKTAQPTVVSPAYQAISDAVADDAYSVLTGAKKPAQAAADLQTTLSGLPLS
ncbi:extracellular solute-binding protein [Jatrophihabitans sp. DSM 45814]